MNRIKPSLFLQIVTFTIGSIILAGYFIRVPWLAAARSLFLEWAVVLGGIILIAGALALSAIHWHNLKGDFRQRVYSCTFLTTMSATFIFLAWDHTAQAWSVWLLKAVFLPIERSLVSLLAFILLAAAVKMAFYRKDGMAVIFLSSALISLLCVSPRILTNLPGAVSSGARWISGVAASAGVRGLLIGVAFGAAIAALRFLLGYNHPQDGR